MALTKCFDRGHHMISPHGSQSPMDDVCCLHRVNWVYEGCAGVGAYTGNAIASIACHEPVAVVDANVVRVVSRLRRLAGDPKSKAAVAAQTALADVLLDPERPGDFNQV